VVQQCARPGVYECPRARAMLRQPTRSRSRGWRLGVCRRAAPVVPTYIPNILYSRVLYIRGVYLFFFIYIYIRDDNAGSGSELVIARYYHHHHHHRRCRHRCYYYKRLLDVTRFVCNIIHTYIHDNIL